MRHRILKATTIVFVLGLFLVVAACAHSDPRREAANRIDKEECESKGGRVEPYGMTGYPACVSYYDDGGKECRDSSECEGNCFVRGIFEVGTPMAGVCESSEHDSMGCNSRITNGKVVSTWCQD